MDLVTIQSLTQQFASAHAELSTLGKAVDAMITQMRDEFAPKARALEKKVRERHAKLAEAIRSAPELFEKPRTITFAGVKVGMAKGKGGITYGDPDDVVARIEKVYRDEAAQYLHIKKCPDKEALLKLTVCELAKLGCEIQDAGDQVVIKPLDGEMTKAAAGLLRQLTAEANSEE